MHGPPYASGAEVNDVIDLGQAPGLSSGEAVTLSAGLILAIALVSDTDRKGLKILGGLGVVLMAGQLFLKRIV